MADKTTLEHFYHWEKTTPNKVYLRQPYGDTFKDFTWQEVGNQARKMAAYLKETLPPRSNVGIASKNCAHWIINDLAIMMAGHVSVPFYATLTSEQLNQVLVHSESKVLFVGKLDHGINFYAGIPADVKIIAYDAEYENSPADKHETWSQITARYEPLQDVFLPKRDDMMTIVYTSGTTGMPKGVMINYSANSDSLSDAFQYIGLSNSNTEARFFSYLPLCHIAERSFVESGSLASNGTVYFTESLELFANNLRAAQPTHFLAVPRIWTKFQMGILAKMPQKKLNLLLNIPVISGLVSGKIRKGLGLDKAKYILTGAAPMSSESIAWYHRLGIKINQAYGMSENMGGHTSTLVGGYKAGTVGKPYPGATTRIDPITGEIQVNSTWNTIGYFKEPEQTKALYTEDGWLKTGDMGELTDDGYLKITGRVKDMFKTTKGEYVVPGPIEMGFAANNYIEQICVTGAILPQPIALVVLSDIGKTADQTEVIESLINDLKAKNQSAQSHEKLSKIVVVKEAWTVDNEMLTPTMKIKRNIVEKTYSPQMENWFDHQDTIIWE
jgi:long-subunit acyl-CoA synthetase (AMP-forming)